MVAVAVSMLVAPGPYDALGAMVAVTLLLLLVAFLAEHRRNRLQSLAIAALGALVAIQLVGFLFEAALTPDPVSFALHNDFPGYRAHFACTGLDCQSRVDGAVALATWVCVMILTFIVDRLWQRRLAGA